MARVGLHRYRVEGSSIVIVFIIIIIIINFHAY